MIKKILDDSSKAIGMLYEGPLSVAARYEKIIITFLQSYEFLKGKATSIWILLIEVCLIAAGTVLGILLTHGHVSLSVKILVCTFYLMITVTIVATGRIVSRTIDTAANTINNYQLMALSERLAAEVVLLTSAGDLEKKDNDGLIDRISKYVPDISDLSEEDQKRIKHCIDHESFFKTSRGTNVTFKKLNVDDDIMYKLIDVSSNIVEFGYSLFGDYHLSAKVYLRSRKMYEGENIELLVSFSKYPAGVRSAYKGPYAEFGSSWVKARGNPSIVWQCLESGQSKYVSSEAFDASYRSVYAICLPGRIGVLAITSSETNAFDSKIDEWVEKSLCYSTEIQINRIFNLTC